MNKDSLEYVVLQKGKKEAAANPNGSGWLLTSNINEYEDLAICLTNYPEVICIDFDSLEENNGYEKKIIEALQKEYPSNLVVQTDKGFHMYYKTSRKISTWNKRLLCAGIKTDAKTGNQYTIIKRFNKLRNYSGSLDFDNLTELPDVLLPLKTKTPIIQAGIKQGSRNDSLFRHLCVVRKFYDDVDISKIAHFINKYLYEPSMDENEVNNIVKSVLNQEIEAIKEEDKTTFFKTVLEVVREYKVHKVNEELFFWNGTHYTNDEFALLKRVYERYRYAFNDINNVLFQLKMNAYPWNEEDIILINNGIIKDGEFIENQQVFTPYYLNVTYDKNSYSSELDKFLQFITCNETSTEANDLRIVIEEMFGHCLMFKNFPHKIFLLVGRGKNGKSTLVNLLYNVFNGMYSNVSLNHIDKDNYVARLVNKLVNISDDIDYNYLVSSQNIKTLASGDYLSARELYGKSFNFKNTATQIYTMNELVKFKDKSFGLERRLCIIPFKNEVKDVDPHMLEKITTEEAKSYFLNLALSGIKRIKANNYQLSESKIISKSLQRYLNENDSVSMFFTFEDLGEIDGRSFSNIYNIYKKFCVDNEIIPCTKNGFSRRLTSKGYTSEPRKKDGHTVRVIIKDNKYE